MKQECLTFQFSFCLSGNRIRGPSPYGAPLPSLQVLELMIDEGAANVLGRRMGQAQFDRMALRLGAGENQGEKFFREGSGVEEKFKQE